jgi:hypothetical protein
MSTASGTSRVPPAPAGWIWLDASTYLVVQTEHFVPQFQAALGHPLPGAR